MDLSFIQNYQSFNFFIQKKLHGFTSIKITRNAYIFIINCINCPFVRVILHIFFICDVQNASKLFFPEYIVKNTNIDVISNGICLDF